MAKNPFTIYFIAGYPFPGFPSLSAARKRLRYLISVGATGFLNRDRNGDFYILRVSPDFKYRMFPFKMF